MSVEISNFIYPLASVGLMTLLGIIALKITKRSMTISNNLSDFVGKIEIYPTKRLGVQYQRTIFKCPRCNINVGTKIITKRMPCPECGCELFGLKEE